MAITDYSHITLRLIRDDIRNVKLVSILSRYYMDASRYKLDLHEAIFELMGLSNYEKFDELKEWYFCKIEEAKLVTIKSLDSAVLDIYAGLKMKYHGKN